MDQSCFNIVYLPKDSRTATKYVVEMLIRNVHPLLRKIWNKLQCREGIRVNDEDLSVKFRDVYSLCSSQIKKCIINLLEVFKHEHQKQMYLQETRQCILERLICCFEKLYSIEELMAEPVNGNGSCSDDLLLSTNMYFVDWIDQTFEILNKLSSLVYRTDCKECPKIYEEWKDDIVDCIRGLHKSVDELLLSAMTLWRYCLPSDQLVVKVRCQVVLRETKALISDLIEGDLDGVFNASKSSLKLPIMPSNTNLLIDVLKDVLYVLETNTNTALLALLVNSFSYNSSPVDALRNHIKSMNNDMCPCKIRYDDIGESCLLVKDFDLYNERLLQIGSFAISCSSDEKRVLCLKSGLASLEALDPHLVPALMLGPDSAHSILLMDSWKREVLEIKNNVYLIVDPTAFSDKVKQMMHQVMLDINKDKFYINAKVCAVINMGCTVYDFFNTYSIHEPEALDKGPELFSLLNDLNKVQLECKVVSNMLCSADDIVYDTNKYKSFKDVSFGQLQKRLKLLYTIVTRINALINPKESDQNFYEDDPVVDNKNGTKTLHAYGVTCVKSPHKINTLSRSIFTRTVNIRSSTKFPLAILTKNLKGKQCKDLSFSVKLDKMCELSSNNNDTKQTTSILYHSSKKTRSSLRKAVLNRQCMALYQDVNNVTEINDEYSVMTEKESLMDGTMSLQITEVLNQINELTNILTAPREQKFDSEISSNQEAHGDADKRNNILRLNINNDNTKFKQVWNISVKSSDSMIGNTSLATNVTQPSNVNTLERISDLEFVENKLSKLLTLEMETSL